MSSGDAASLKKHRRSIQTGIIAGRPLFHILNVFIPIESGGYINAENTQKRAR
ncbi:MULTISPECIES: hypothetical protein [Campylobacter]|uniref:hypothetical protein n=1 Tax=Campylobacter TaxID=194 RepID=UPI0023F3BEE4|nr:MULTISPECIES: hypothetical protein [Campylobacter]MCI6642053.1 hypothetical protein [Campylobacter sp.]MDD7422807.1 hypothetical protein [Campylobacter hominis]MDY3117894.1 hypothetical protein [Campylobacter hominis]